MQLLRETTNWDCQYNVPNFDYLLEAGAGARLLAFRRSENHPWEKFDKPRLFSKKHRSFKKLKGPIPTEFVRPISINVEEKREHQSLEFFMS